MLYKFYLYTNNNNLRHYGSLDSIVPKSQFQTDKYYRSFCDYFPHSLILTPVCPNLESIKFSFQDEVNDILFPVVLELEMPSSKFSCTLVNKNLETKSGRISDYDPDSHLLLIVNSFIPFSFVQKIIFPSESNLKNFISTKNTNAEFKIDDCFVDEDLFNGAYEINLNSINVSVTDDDDTYGLFPQPRAINRTQVRAFIHSLIYFGRFTIDDFLNFKFDLYSLQIIKDSFSASRHNIDKETDRISQAINKEFSNNKISHSFQLASLNRGFLLEKYNIRDLIPNSMEIRSNDIREPFQLTNPSDIYLYYDVLAAQIAIKLAFCSDGSHFDRRTYLENFFQLILNHIPSNLNNNFNNHLDGIKALYTNIQKGVLEFLQNRIKVNEVLEKLEKFPQSFHTVKSILFFVSSFEKEKFDSLSEKLGKFSQFLNQSDIRLIWCLWSALNGMVYLGYALKKDRRLLYLSDITTSFLLKEISEDWRIFNINPKFRKKTAAAQFTSDSKVVITTCLGLEFELDVLITPTSMYKRLISDQKYRHSKTLKDIFLNIPQSSGFLAWRLSFNTNDSIKINTLQNRLQIESNSKPVLQPFWKSWDKFYDTHIMVENSFYALVTPVIFNKLKVFFLNEN